MNEKTQLNLPLTERFKDAIDAAAFKANKSTVAFIRETLATAIGYDLAQDITPRKVRRFASREEYKEYYKLKARADRATAKRVIELIDSGVIQLPDE